jgi:hypothetical protein
MVMLEMLEMEDMVDDMPPLEDWDDAAVAAGCGEP